MSDTPNEPLPSEPPTNTGGNTTLTTETEELDTKPESDPPTNTGGGSSSA